MRRSVGLNNEFTGRIAIDYMTASAVAPLSACKQADGVMANLRRTEPNNASDRSLGDMGRDDRAQGQKQRTYKRRDVKTTSADLCCEPADSKRSGKL